MPKYPNGCKVTTKKSESCKANEINLLCTEGISQLYLSSELIIHEVVHDCNVFHLYASSSLGYGVCPYCGHVSSQVHSRYSRTIYYLSIFETDERNGHFLATMPIHLAFVDEKAYLASIGKELDEGGKKDDKKDFGKENNIELSERQTIILKLITKDCTITSEKISEKISEKKPVTTRTIEKDIAQLKQYGILYREGGRKDGRWVIMNKNDNKE